MEEHTMELREINTFLVAADKMNFSKAAEQLGYSQAAVTIQIKNLEKELGTLLFDRIGKSIYLTEKGKEFLKHAQKILLYTEESISDIKNEKDYSGMIRIGTSESILAASFPSLITSFHQMYPNMHICIKTGTRNFIFDLMLHNELDMAYTIDQNVIDHVWTGKILREEKVYFVASSQNPLAKKQTVTIEEILQEELIMTECNIGYTYELSQHLARKGLGLHPYLETGNTDIIRSFVAQNKGVSYLPLFTIQNELKEKSIVPIRVPEFEVNVYRQLFWHKNKYITKPMNDLMKLIQSN
ncbi:LysR family transcriptional regulator [Candidatus Galacturonibacter soehngenii]|uniref:LysR family transcriptional regulator n=2 Tax=Candidatus Galacturonatibacter soehngenii TaxID=2307010 RepID=A0A7V7QMI8_9FIRM|nr:LysR family transcriptional regulator [Candidatus Galacturonibacter soehngenii]